MSATCFPSRPAERNNDFMTSLIEYDPLPTSPPSSSGKI